MIQSIHRMCAICKYYTISCGKLPEPSSDFGIQGVSWNQSLQILRDDYTNISMHRSYEILSPVLRSALHQKYMLFRHIFIFHLKVNPRFLRQRSELLLPTSRNAPFSPHLICHRCHNESEWISLHIQGLNHRKGPQNYKSGSLYGIAAQQPPSPEKSRES